MGQIQTASTNPPQPASHYAVLAGMPAPGGAAPAAAPAPGAPAGPSLNADPAFNAFVSKLGLTNDDLTNAAQTRAAGIQEGVTAREPGMARNEGIREENLNGRMESRGILNSSEALNALGNQQAAHNDQVAAMHNAAAQQVAGIYGNLLSQIAARQTAAASAGDAAAGRLTIGAAQAGQPAIDGIPTQ